MSDPTPTPSADTIEWAAEMLGCISWFRGQTRIVCESHGNADWPCPVAVDLATHIEDRDRARDANLIERLDRAAERLDTAAGERPEFETQRLLGKAAGVRLAVSYVQDRQAQERQ